MKGVLGTRGTSIEKIPSTIFPAWLSWRVRGVSARERSVIAASQAAVAAGEAESVSAWVNDVLHLKAEHDRRLRGIDDFIEAYEAEHGEITEDETEDEMDAAVPVDAVSRDRRPWWPGDR